MIPDRLTNFNLLKIHSPESDCEHPGKQPIGSATKGPFYHASDSELVRHIENGGNVGIPLNGPLIVFDVDHTDFRELLDRDLPMTFKVRTGSGGEHWYYHAPNWSDNRQIKVNGQDWGSIRSDSWQVIIPPSIHPVTGQRYKVVENRVIRSISPDEINSVLSRIETKTSQHSGGGCVGSSSDPSSIPREYPARPADWETCKSWLTANGFLEDLTIQGGDRSAREFKLAKCLAEGGFSKPVIFEVLDRLPHNSKWHERGSNYQYLTVHKAIIAACNDPYVSFDNSGDMELDGSESRKTETTGKDGGSTGWQTGIKGGDPAMPDFTDKLEVPILEGSEAGDSFRKVVLVEGNDNGDSFEYIALKKGRIQKAKTTDGDTVLAENVQDSVSLGSPEYIDELVRGLEALKEKLAE